MDIEIRPCASVEELRDGLNAISHYFGAENQLEDAERFAQLIEVDRMHAAFDGDRIVGGAGAFTYRMTVPGGVEVAAAGVTVVGVLPTHRRRGVLTSLMKAQLADCRARGDLAAYLWASEGTIYGRFGYGLASRMGSMSLAKDRSRFAQPFEPRGRVRLVDFEEAARTFPALYDEVRLQRPGAFSRSTAWWETRRLFDDPARRQGGQLNRALLELDGKPAGYALYRVKQDWQHGFSKGVVSISEAVAPTPAATRELWRWLLDFDWTSEFSADLLPLDHPLFLLLAEPRRMQFTINDGVWVRLLDVGAALSARTYAGDGEVVLEVSDGLLPENAGRWRVSGAGGASERRRLPTSGSTSLAWARCISAASASATSCGPRGQRSSRRARPNARMRSSPPASCPGAPRSSELIPTCSRRRRCTNVSTARREQRATRSCRRGPSSREVCEAGRSSA